MQLHNENWTIQNLREHIQAAFDLELWTIPFYMSAMYSVKDRSTPAYQMIRTVVNQEMLHLQCAANLANAYGFSPTVSPPTYEGKKVPHLDFGKDNPAVTAKFTPYVAQIGPLDLEHINAMCLVELPEFIDDADGVGDVLLQHVSKRRVLLHSNVADYPTIGALYTAIYHGAELLQNQIRGGVRQIDYFSAFYRNAPSLTITESGAAGFHQVALLIQLIMDQGEGQSKSDPTVPKAFQNTADDKEPHEDHFEKFRGLRRAFLVDPTKQPVDIHMADPAAEQSENGQRLQNILVAQFSELTMLLESLFGGENPGDFFPTMAGVGAAINNCWINGVTPKFSDARQVAVKEQEVEA